MSPIKPDMGTTGSLNIETNKSAEYSVTFTKKCADCKKVQVSQRDWEIGNTFLSYEWFVQNSDNIRKKLYLNLVVYAFERGEEGIIWV